MGGSSPDWLLFFRSAYGIRLSTTAVIARANRPVAISIRAVLIQTNPINIERRIHDVNWCGTDLYICAGDSHVGSLETSSE